MTEELRGADAAADCEPGFGKSGLVARLAADNPGWLQYFIRSDQRSPAAASTDARSFLLYIGAQFAAVYPELFTAEQVTVEVGQRIGAVDPDGSVVGVGVEVEVEVEVERTATTPRWCAGAIELGHNLGMTVVAEGVEGSAHVAALQALGCDIAQDTTMPDRCPPRTLPDGSAAGT